MKALYLNACPRGEDIIELHCAELDCSTSLFDRALQRK